MRTVDLTNIKLGDTLAIRKRGSWRGVSYRLLIVDRITSTQVCCKNAEGGGGEWRFRKSDGKQIGEKCSYAQLGTPELIDQTNKQVEQERRRVAAFYAVSDLGNHVMHGLSLEQLEALAMAWTAIKAMKPAA